MHYRIVKNGFTVRESPIPYRKMSAVDKILENVHIGDGCWEWHGSIGVQGYGKIRFDGKHLRAHRLSYMAFIGAIPDGMQLDHLCENKSCVNPYHLEPVTIKENINRYWKNRREEYGKNPKKAISRS